MLKLAGRSVLLGRKLVTAVPQNQVIRNSHSPGGIPGEVKFLSEFLYYKVAFYICRLAVYIIIFYQKCNTLLSKTLNCVFVKRVLVFGWKSITSQIKKVILNTKARRILNAILKNDI